MQLLTPKTSDEGMEKHVPVVEETEAGIKIKVGSVEHPMTAEHHIEFIVIVANGEMHIKHLKLGEKPEAEFNVKTKKALAYCNLHGLWGLWD